MSYEREFLGTHAIAAEGGISYADHAGIQVEVAEVRGEAGQGQQAWPSSLARSGELLRWALARRLCAKSETQCGVPLAWALA